jgi:alpha-mannosidase
MSLAATLALALATAAPAQEIWRIGESDNSYDEFACARNYGAYAATFPNDVTYRVGQSTPKKDWSFVHPGPSDSWAGGRLHPFTVLFSLPEKPATPLRLVVDLVGVQGLMGSSLGLRVNDVEGVFHLERGQEGTIGNPAAGKEQVVSVVLAPSLFRAGENRLVLSSLGSWFCYDAISLSAETGAPMKTSVRSLTLEPTIMFKRLPDGGLGQVVLARVDVEGPPEGLTLTTEVAARKAEIPLKPGITFGTIEQELLIPEVTQDTPITAEARAGDSVVRAEMTLKPERKWRIYMAPSTHTDIGYTDLQSRVEERHDDNTDRALALCEKYPAFGWNLETSWQADIYRRDRPEEACQKLYALAQKGQIGVQASYLNMLTALCSHEELNRWLYYAASLKRRYGVPFESALTTDVPTQAWSVPSTLAAAGIRYYATGINTTRGYTFTKLMTGHPYWWEGPDGSRVLAYFAPGYAHAGGPLSSVDDLRKWILDATRNRADFPYDALFLYGGFGDNQPLQENIGATAQMWSEMYEFPKVIVGPNAEYFKYMEATFGDALPVVRGDGGHYWEDGAASSAWETTLNRRAHENASAADALSALARAAGGPPVPGTSLPLLWRNILLYDEHTWGAWCSISEPDSTQTVEQWKVKAQFAYDADRQGKDLLGKALTGLAGRVQTAGPALLLFNATSWEREGEVFLAPLPPGMVPADCGTGRPLPAVDLDADKPSGPHDVAFRTPSIPAWGYVVCPLAKGQPARPATPSETGPPVLENGALRLTFDPKTGAVASLVDKRTGRECVDQSAPHKLNEYLYVSGGDGTNIVDIGANKPADLTIHEPAITRITKVVLPGLGAWVAVEGQCEKTPKLGSVVMLWGDEDRVFITNRVTREAERKKEAAYFAFPFGATGPEVRLEIPNGVMRPEVDQLPGACKDWYSLQHFARVSGKEGSLAWASPDAPLVCVTDINRGLWLEKLDVKNGHLYSYIMNNYWFTNYKADQSGDLEFRYAITTQADTDAAAARFGWQAAMPLGCQVIPAAQDGPLPGKPTSLCRVNRPDVFVSAIKAPEAGPGLIVRLFSLASKPVTVRVTLGVPFSTATLCNLIEEPVESLRADGSSFSVRVKPQQPTTVWAR